MVWCCVCGHMDNNTSSIIVQVYCFSNCNLAVTLAHCLVQPYKKKWLNMCDTCLLLDLLFLSALLSDQNQNIPQMKEKAIYLLVVIPLCFIGVVAIGIITVRTGLFSLVKWFSKMFFSKYKRQIHCTIE